MFQGVCAVPDQLPLVLGHRPGSDSGAWSRQQSRVQTSRPLPATPGPHLATRSCFVTEFTQLC